MTMSSAVYVRNVVDEERLQINVDLSTADGGLKTFNLNRLKKEEHGIALDRLRLNLLKKTANKKKKMKKPANGDASSGAEVEATISLDIFQDGQKLMPSIENEKAWVEGAVLRYEEEDISISFNVPSIKLDKLPSMIMTGFPLFPVADVDFCDLEGCDVYWKVIEKDQVDKFNLHISKRRINDVKDASFHHSLIYTPSDSDVGKHILLMCVPKNQEKEGKPDTLISTSVIQSGPGACPFEKRHEFTKTRSKEKEFRVISYNLLADVYSSTEFAQNHLFAYCPKEALNMRYRKHLLLKEIIGYQADLMCFQEVDKSIFECHLKPAFKSLGFEGFLRPKSGSTSEGCATFVRSDKFRCINQLDITLSEFLSQDTCCRDIWEKVEKIAPLKEKIEQRSTILQVTIVESLEKPNHYLCVANTHLYFHPDACNLRLIQAAVALRHLQNICTSYEQEGKTIAVVFCGDFNSGPHLGIFQLFTSQFVPADHVDWSSGGPEEVIMDLELSQSMDIVSACGVPEYTNFTDSFRCTLDYIYVDGSKLKTTSVVPMPEHADLSANVAIPSTVFPSDHIALVCDLEFSS